MGEGMTEQSESLVNIVGLHAMKRMAALIPSVGEKRARLHAEVDDKWTAREAFVWVSDDDTARILTGKIDEVRSLEDGIRALATQYRHSVNFADMRPVVEALRPVTQGTHVTAVAVTDEGAQFSLYIDHVPPDEKGRGRICLAMIGLIE